MHLGWFANLILNHNQYRENAKNLLKACNIFLAVDAKKYEQDVDRIMLKIKTNQEFISSILDMEQDESAINVLNFAEKRLPDCIRLNKFIVNANDELNSMLISTCNKYGDFPQVSEKDLDESDDDDDNEDDDEDGDEDE